MSPMVAMMVPVVPVMVPMVPMMVQVVQKVADPVAISAVLASVAVVVVRELFAAVVGAHFVVSAQLLQPVDGLAKDAPAERAAPVPVAANGAYRLQSIDDHDKVPVITGEYLVATVGTPDVPTAVNPSHRSAHCAYGPVNQAIVEARVGPAEQICRAVAWMPVLGLK